MAGAILAIIVIAAIAGYSMFQVQKTPSEQGKKEETSRENYGLVTIKVVDQFNNELKANISIDGKEGVSPFTLTLPYGVYKVIAKYKEFMESQTIKVNQAIQDVQIVITIPEKPKGVVIINPFKIEGKEKIWLVFHQFWARVTILDERGKEIVVLHNRYSRELEYGKYFYTVSWNAEGKNWEEIIITKNGTFTIEHPFQELSVILDLKEGLLNGTVKVIVNVLTPSPVKIKEISAEALFDKIRQVYEEEEKGIYNSETALWLYSLAGKKIIVTNGKIWREDRQGNQIYFTIISDTPGVVCHIFAEGMYSPEKDVKEKEVISFEGKVLSVNKPGLTIEMTYDRLIAKK